MFIFLLNPHIFFATDKAKISDLGKCEVEGKSYRIGEQIYPEGELCYKCHCAENFNNKTSFAENPNCVKIDCGIELRLLDIKAGCVPVYYKKPTCCPIEYKCRKLVESFLSVFKSDPVCIYLHNFLF